jgi:hypothetical protein
MPPTRSMIDLAAGTRVCSGVVVFPCVTLIAAPVVLRPGERNQIAAALRGVEREDHHSPEMFRHKRRVFEPIVIDGPAEHGGSQLRVRIRVPGLVCPGRTSRSAWRGYSGPSARSGLQATTSLSVLAAMSASVR